MTETTTQTPPPETEDMPTIERHPWSELAQEFAEVWGKADEGNPQPEHVEVIGPTRSGKTLWTCKAVQERMIVRHTPCVILQSKPADDTVMKLGWPVITDGNVQKVRRERWSIFWPQTNTTGRARKEYQADKFRDLLNSLWRPQSNIIIVYDDVGYMQSLNASDGEPLNPIVEMYLREGGSSGITNVLVKQRPQGAKREMHSETFWKAAFPPVDTSDRERFAELFGPRKIWQPIFEGMDSSKHEFLIKHFPTNTAFISWVDTPLTAVKRPDRDAKTRA
jgi:hypothetical protein